MILTQFQIITTKLRALQADLFTQLSTSSSAARAPTAFSAVQPLAPHLFQPLQGYPSENAERLRTKPLDDLSDHERQLLEEFQAGELVQLSSEELAERLDNFNHICVELDLLAENSIPSRRAMQVPEVEEVEALDEAQLKDALGPLFDGRRVRS